MRYPDWVEASVLIASGTTLLTATVYMQQPIPGTSGDITVNAAVFLAIVVSVVTALVSAITFLYRQQSTTHAAVVKQLQDTHDKLIKQIQDAHAGEIERITVFHGQTLAGRDSSIENLNHVIELYNQRIEALRNMVDGKERQMYELATNAIAQSRESLNKLADAISDVGKSMEGLSSQEDKNHEKTIAILTLMSQKLGARVSIGEADAGSGPDISIRTGSVSKSRSESDH